MVCDARQLELTDEKRVRGRKSIDPKEFSCYCQISLSNGYIQVQAGVVDISQFGIKLVIPIKPALNWTIFLNSRCHSEEFVLNCTPVVVRWIKELSGSDHYLVGCEVENSKVNLEDKFQKWFLNY